MGGQFLSPLDIRDTERENEEGRALWFLLALFGYKTESGAVIWVPPRFITDFGSIPRLFWRFESPIGRSRRAAVIHDWLYASGLYPREDADKIFLEAMKACGVPKIKRELMYQAVRTFGAKGYMRPEEHKRALELSFYG